MATSDGADAPAVRTLVGSAQVGVADGQGASASFHNLYGVAVDGYGDMFVAEAGGLPYPYDADGERIRKVTPHGFVTTFAGSGKVGFRNGCGRAAKFDRPVALDVDGYGNVIVGDARNNSIRKISINGVVTTLAGNGDRGHVDGEGANARFHFPTGVAVDGDGSVLICDTGNHLIRKLGLDGAVTTLAGSGVAGYANGNGAAAEFNLPTDVAVDGDGNIIIADCKNHQIRKMAPSGAVMTLAGNGVPGHADGVGATAQFYDPTGVAIDGDGNVVVADSNNVRIRMIAPNGTVTTLAGTGVRGHVDGAGAAAQFGRLHSVAVDGDGGVVITDGGRLRLLAAGLRPVPSRPGAAPRLPPSKRRRFSDDLGRLLMDAPFADVTFIVEGSEVLAHRSFLSAASLYFRTMLASRFREGGSPSVKVDVQDTTPAAFWAMLQYLYTNVVDLDGASASHVIQVMRLAHRYELAELHYGCVMYGRRVIAVDNCVEWLLQADKYAIDEMRALALAVVARHLHNGRLQAEAAHTVQALADNAALAREVCFQRPFTKAGRSRKDSDA